MIVVLSLNTALDRILVVPRFSVGEVFRAERSEVFAGGKGINVARVLRQLDVPVRVVGFLGGLPEPFIRDRLARAGIDQRWVTVDGESRTCVIVVDPISEEQTVLNEPGPHVSPAELDRVRSTLADSTGPGDILCVSGSAPPGVPDELYGDIIRDMQERGVRTLIDASGGALRAGLLAAPWAAAPNVEECASAIGSGEPMELARRLSEHAEHALLTMGAEGLLYAHRGTVRTFRAPRVKTVNAVGSGDALVAGFLAGIEQGMEPADALRLGMACGAVNAGRLEPGIDPAAVRRITQGEGEPGEERFPARPDEMRASW
jgi:tagatose 6-phosphate kinase